jgi:hypothetical protein
MRKERRLAASYLIFLSCLIAFLIWPVIPTGLIAKAQSILSNIPSRVLACIPLSLYAVLGFGIRGYLWKIPPDAQQAEGDKQQSASLTLSGFCFTSLSLLVGYFRDSIKAGDGGAEGIILFFCCALACFVASYMALRYRNRNIFGFMSDAFIDNGFWCVMIGLWRFFHGSVRMNAAASVVALLLVFYSGYLILNFFYYAHYVRKTKDLVRA